MLPSLLPVVAELSREFRIAHLRIPTSRLAWGSSGSLLRTAAINALARVNRDGINGRGMQDKAADFLGMEVSGRLGLPYLRRILPRLRAGRVYELMCHPGRRDAGEAAPHRLTRYHDWEGELRTLTDPAARDLIDAHGVRLIGYRHTDIVDGRLVVRSETA